MGEIDRVVKLLKQGRIEEQEILSYPLYFGNLLRISFLLLLFQEHLHSGSVNSSPQVLARKVILIIQAHVVLLQHADIRRFVKFMQVFGFYLLSFIVLFAQVGAHLPNIQLLS